MKKTVVFLCILMILTGCTGSFRFTRNVHHINRQIEEKWLEEGVFIVFLPVYGLSLLGDALVFNSIEFWYGRNPIKTASLEEAKTVIVYDRNNNTAMWVPTVAIADAISTEMDL